MGAPAPRTTSRCGTDEPGDVESAWVDADELDWAPLPSTELADALPPLDPPAAPGVLRGRRAWRRTGALGLLRLLQDSDGLLEGVGPDDRVAVVSFEHHFKIWLDFTADLERARATCSPGT